MTARSAEPLSDSGWSGKEITVRSFLKVSGRYRHDVLSAYHIRCPERLYKASPMVYGEYFRYPARIQEKRTGGFFREMGRASSRNSLDV